MFNILPNESGNPFHLISCSLLLLPLAFTNTPYSETEGQYCMMKKV